MTAVDGAAGSEPDPTSAPLLAARRLGRRHPGGKGWLLDDVSLELESGERLALTGPSGSGKTLLLRALALLDPTDRGEIRFAGRPIVSEGVPDYRRQVTYAHQRPALFPGTVEENLRRPFELAVHRGRGFERSRVLELLAAVDRSESFLAQRAGDLSGGEAQITALIRILQLDPRVLLLDEPTAGLDADATASVEGLLERWLDERPEAAMVWVGHDLEQSARLTSRRVRIRGGALELGDAPGVQEADGEQKP